MLNAPQLTALQTAGRVIGPAVAGDTALGPLADLPGTWSNANLPGRGWNMIALPFAGNGPFHYRLLLNQYNETLTFATVDKGVPNRGISATAPVVETDQFLAALDYRQQITQVDSVDSPPSTLRPTNGKPIHFEPGLWLHLANQFDGGLDVVRMGTIPHGDAVNAIGTHREFPTAPVIPDISGLPIGDQAVPDLNSPYLAPYKQFHQQPFKGIFDPVHPNGPLVLANQGVTIVKTTEVKVDTRTPTGGIVNIPFVTKQANATEMQFTMWIQQVRDATGKTKLRLQYSQVVFLEFFPRRDGQPGSIRWPHVSVNTLEKTP
ncbi:MAG: hypothetical protein RLZZ15_160 [Verrucomicrobiota bacterium]